MATILIIEDEPILARNLRDAVQFGGHDAALARTGEEAIDIVESIRPHLILTDFRLPGVDGLEVLRRVKCMLPGTDFIVITAHGEVSTAVQAMKAGARDFLVKPLDLHELCVTIDRVLRQRSEAIELHYHRERELSAAAVDNIVGQSQSMRDVRALVRRIGELPSVASHAPPCVLITGETGTGKDLVARAIHCAGPRREAQFVHVNCTAISEHLAESELFGHVKGAFTDARTDKIGLFELADQGTLFLDEIGHMSLALQAKLLTAIDQRSIRPVGGARERKVNVHLIAATNRLLKEAIDNGEFRADLFHRLKVLTLHLPPLRARGGDAVLLARHFLRMHAVRIGTVVEDFSDDSLAAIRTYDWPGNVRELAHAVERAVLFADQPVIQPMHLNLQTADESSPFTVELPGRETLRLEFVEGGPTLEDIEHQILLAALNHSSHNLSRAARVLGISRDAIRYRLDRFRRRTGPSDS